MHMSTANDEWTVGRLLGWTSKFFEDKDLEDSLLAAQLLLCKVMNCSKVQLYMQFESLVDDKVRTAYRELVKQAVAGQPIAYLVGAKEFYSLEFEVDARVLIPRPETELLVQWVVRKARCDEHLSQCENINILELGVGSGCIAVSLAKFMPRPSLITAVDISADSLELAAGNCRKHQVQDSITLTQSNLFEAIDADNQYDFIVCNLPYITEGDYDALPKHIKDYEPKSALFAGPDGLDLIRPAIVGGRDYLKHGGCIVLEIGYDQSSAVQKLLQENGYVEIAFEKDQNDIDRVAIGRVEDQR